VIQWLSAGLAFAAIVAFALLFSVGIVQVWIATSGSPPHYDQPFLDLATGIGTFVGGVVAVAFGIKPTSQPNQSMLRRNLASLGAVPFVPTDLRPFLGGLYAVVYVALGIAAVATWIVHPNESSDLVKNFAVTFVGLALPIIGAYFRT
jgi:hypothetical protein